SHVAKAGSDVLHLFFKVLPRLRPGVWIHIHDIFYPFDYPKEWIQEGRAWNEAYLLRAFLSFNPSFKVRLWNDQLRRLASGSTVAVHPDWAQDPGGSIWLERIE